MLLFGDLMLLVQSQKGHLASKILCHFVKGSFREQFEAKKTCVPPSLVICKC